MRKSNCKFCVEGVVMSDDCNKVIGHCYCDIDNYDEDIGCNPQCHGYRRNNYKKEGDVEK